MFEINRILLTKTLLFDSLDFEVPKGLSVLYGLNQSSAKTSGNGNAAGKSALVSQFGEILFEEPIVGTKKDAVKSGRRQLDMMFDKTPVKLTRINTKTELAVNGKKGKKLRTKAFYKEWLNKNLPISKMEYDTYVHLDARKAHPLVMGSSVERKRFFTQFFALDKMDIERRLFMAELNTLQRTRAAYNELAKEYARVRESALGQDEREHLVKKVRIKRKRLVELQQQATELSNLGQLLQFEANSGEQLEQLFKVMQTRDVQVEEYDDKLTLTSENLRANKANLNDAQRYERYLVERSAYDKAVSQLGEAALALIEAHGQDTATEKARKRARAYRDAVSELEQVDRKASKLERVVGRDIKSELKHDKKARDYDEAELRAERKALKHQLQHAEKFKRGQCETCGQDVVVKSPKKIQQRIDAIDEKLDAVEAYAAYSEARAEQKEAVRELAEVNAVREKLRETVAKNKKYVKIAVQLIDLPTKPNKFVGRKMEVNVLQRMVDEDRDTLQLLKLMRPNLDTIIALSQLTKSERKKADAASELHQAINEMQEYLSRNDSVLAVDDARQEDLAALKVKLKKLKLELADEEALKLLIEGYSEKEMKRMAVRLIGRRLMTEVNKYARLVFTEDYVFDFEWKSSDLNLIVNRRYDAVDKKGKKTGKKVVKTSDVRKLSGAESKLFTIVLVMALLTFVPERRRCNLMILDEPSANMSPETLKQFQDILPVLNQIIPSIIVVTPDATERYKNAKEFTMVKVNGMGRLVTGHPDQHKKRISA